MVRLEDQVCSFERAKQFKEIGFPQHSLFYWIFHTVHGTKYISYGKPVFEHTEPNGFKSIAHIENIKTYEIYSAYTEVEFQYYNRKKGEESFINQVPSPF